MKDFSIFSVFLVVGIGLFFFNLFQIKSWLFQDRQSIIAAICSLFSLISIVLIVIYKICKRIDTRKFYR